MNQWLPSSSETRLALPSTSWISVPPVSNTMDATFLQALSDSSISSLLPDPLRTKARVVPTQPNTIPTLTTPPSMETIYTQLPGTSTDGSLSATPAGQKIKRRAIPIVSSSSLSTIYPAAGIGVNVQFGEQNHPLRNTGSVISLPDSIKDQPGESKNDFPEVVERNDWPENLSSLPSITLRPASPVKDYKPFRFEPITRYLHHPTLIVSVRRDVPVATPNYTGITPIGFRTHTVSNPHCEFSYQGGQWFVRDVGSGNGTWLNGVRLSVSDCHKLI